MQKLGIEADLILFHPYDGGHWGFDRMTADEDDRYLRYVVARLAAFRNVWWSLANEWDFMKEKREADFERFGRIVRESDPSGHLLSIHNGKEIVDQYEIRTALECFIVRSIAGHLREEQIARLEDNLSAQKAILKQSKVQQGVALDAAFHIMLAEFLGNQEILRVMKQLREKIQRVVLLVVHASPQRIDTSYPEHRAIADAVIQGQADQAARLIEEHLERGRQLILAPRGR